MQLYLSLCKEAKYLEFQPVHTRGFFAHREIGDQLRYCLLDFE
jgi:hypothetical protein